MLLLDSALASDAHRAAELGYVSGATTNPTLIAQSGQPAREVIAMLLATLPGPVFYQPVGTTSEAIVAEGHAIASLDPSRVVLKLPCTLAGLAAGARLRGEVDYGFTAVFTPAQVIVAAAAGGRYVLPYLNRLTRLVGDGPGIIRQLASVARDLELVVASIKSPEEAVAALAAGAHRLTLPLAVLEAMAHSPLTELALEEFQRASRPPTSATTGHAP
ncbi:MAG: putative transaldolase [Dehalococcoidia bacterium]|nr:MAG: putative transaldolase [Dehalococcoidia bacterium]